MVILLFGSIIQIIIVFAFLSFTINYFFMQRIKHIDGIKNIIFWLQLTLIGVLSFYLIYTHTFTSIFWSIALYFIPVYILTTGFTISLIGYISKDK